MEEVDGIIILSLRQNGVELADSVTSLKDFDTDVIVAAVSTLLNALSKGGEKHPTKLPPEMSARFRICSALASFVKRMGYKKDLGFKQFLYPELEGTRDLLMWLVERVAPTKEEEEAPGVLDAAEAVMQRVAGELTAAVKTPWTPHLIRPARASAYVAPHTFTALPLDGAEPRRSEPERTAYAASAHLPVLTAQVTARRNVAASVVAYNATSYIRARREETHMGSLDGGRARGQRSAGFGKWVGHAMRAATHGTTTLQATMEQVLSMHEDGAAGEGQGKFARDTAFGQETSDDAGVLGAGSGAGGAGPGGEVDAEAEKEAAEERKRRQVREKLEAEARAREEELAALQEQLHALIEGARGAAKKSEVDQATLRQAEELLGAEEEKTVQLESQYMILKRTLDLLDDAERNMKQLTQISQASAQRLLELGIEWEKHRAPLVAQLREAKASFSQRKLACKTKLERIKELREEMRRNVADINAKETQYNALVEEYSRLPRNINRAMYTKRILEIQKQVEKQKVDIDRILLDTRTIQKEINSVSETLNRSFTATDELVFRDAKRDSNIKQAYKDLAKMHADFARLVQVVEETGSMANQIRDLETKMEQIHSRNTALNMERVVSDLKEIKAENNALAAQLGQ